MHGAQWNKVVTMPWCIVLMLWCISAVSCQNCRGEEPRVRECEKVCDQSGSCTIRAALLFPKNTTYDVSLPAVESVFELATQHPDVKDVFPSWINFEWMMYDVTDCDAAYAIITSIDAYNDCAHVFFGPPCDYALASVARIAKFLGSTGTPMITTGGFTFDFVETKQSCLDEFYMLVRAGPLGFQDVAYFIIDLMKHFNWRQLLLINEPKAQHHIAGRDTCHLFSKTFVNNLKKEGIKYTPWDTTSNGGLNYTENLKFNLDFKYTSKFGWERVIILYDSPAYETYVGSLGGFLLASTIHEYMIYEGIDVFGRELQMHLRLEDILIQNVGNNYASEFRVTLGFDEV